MNVIRQYTALHMFAPRFYALILSQDVYECIWRRLGYREQADKSFATALFTYYSMIVGKQIFELSVLRFCISN